MQTHLPIPFPHITLFRIILLTKFYASRVVLWTLQLHTLTINVYSRKACVRCTRNISCLLVDLHFHTYNCIIYGVHLMCCRSTVRFSPLLLLFVKSAPSFGEFVVCCISAVTCTLESNTALHRVFFYLI